MQGRIRPTIIFLLFIGFGSYIYYLFGYRNEFLSFVIFAANVIGWLVFFTDLGAIEQLDKKSGCLKLLGSLLGLIVFGGYVLGVKFLGDRRVETILASQPTKQTTATVVEVGVEHSKSGSTPYTIVLYKTDKESVNERLPTEYSEYSLPKLGDTLTIKYSIEYPHMIKVVP